MTAKVLAILFIALLAFGLNPVRASAAPRFTLTPGTDTKSVNDQFTVTLGVNTDGQSVSSYDVWMTFDSSLLELVSVTRAGDAPFLFEFQPHIFNDTGKFDTSIVTPDTVTHSAVAANGNLLLLTFKAKASGTARLNFACVAGNSGYDTNMFVAQSGGGFRDVVECTANQSGSYVITGSSSATATATPTSALVPTKAKSLPQTGGIADTILVSVLGILGVGLGVFLLAL